MTDTKTENANNAYMKEHTLLCSEIISNLVLLANVNNGRYEYYHTLTHKRYATLMRLARFLDIEDYFTFYAGSKELKYDATAIEHDVGSCYLTELLYVYETLSRDLEDDAIELNELLSRKYAKRLNKYLDELASGLK